jgi:hypothetical protein
MVPYPSYRTARAVALVVGELLEARQPQGCLPGWPRTGGAC